MSQHGDSYSSWSDTRLVNACLRGDEPAWSALIARYKRLICSFPFRYGVSPQDVGDVFQAVCVKLCVELPRLRKTESLRSWLISVAANESFQWQRRRHLRAQQGVGEFIETLPDGAALPPQLLEQAEREQIVRDAIARLSPRCRQLIQHLFFDQPAVPYAELARRLGLATGSIGFYRGHCLKRLQARLEEMDL